MSKDNLEDKIEAIRLSYIETMGPKKSDIERHWAVLKEQWNDETQKNLYMIVHGIAGSAETFGFPELTRQSRAALDQLKRLNQAVPDNQFIDDLDVEIDELLALMNAINNPKP